MIVEYGGYQHKQNSTGITISAEVEETDTGVPFRVNTRVDIEGRLHNELRAPASRLDGIIAAMENAYSHPGGDFGLLHDDGRRSSAYWYNSRTIGGIRPKFLAYPNYRGGDYVTYRSFQIAVQFTTPIGPTPKYSKFTETLSIDGGCPVFGIKEVNFGTGVRQRYRTHSKCVAVQSGSAVARNNFPEIPPPIWPFALKSQLPKITKVIRPRGGGYTRNYVLEECEITWSYEYEWTTRLEGIPHYVTP